VTWFWRVATVVSRLEGSDLGNKHGCEARGVANDYWNDPHRMNSVISTTAAAAGGLLLV